MRYYNNDIYISTLTNILLKIYYIFLDQSILQFAKHYSYNLTV